MITYVFFCLFNQHLRRSSQSCFSAAVAASESQCDFDLRLISPLGTLLQHAGYDLSEMKLPLIPVTFGNIETAVSFYAVGWLQGLNAAEHDWHHEKFTTNYALSFKYLDKLFGSYHQGRVPGEATAVVLKAKRPENARASYTALKDATIEDFLIQGQAFDAYAESGAIVNNILGCN